MSKGQLENLIGRIRERSGEAGQTLAAMRADMEATVKVFPVEEDIACATVDAGGVAGEWTAAPGVAEERVLLYLHGGGYAVGSIASHRSLVGRLSRAAGMRALSLDYRLAPENPFPAAVEDGRAAFLWLVGEGIRPERIVIAGDSAGGGLTLATLLALRDGGHPLPAAGVCLSPFTDLALTGESLQTKQEVDPMLTLAGARDFAVWYLGKTDPRTPWASPLYADFTGLPPLLIQVGTAEMLLDDATRVAERARAAGVEVTLEPWEDMIHVWQFFAPFLDEGRQAIARIGEYCRERMA